MTNTSFVPQGYKPPSKSDQFFKPQSGKNKIRVMSDKLVAGWLFFGKNEEGQNYPYRKKADLADPTDRGFSDEEMISLGCKMKGDKPEPQKYFWLMLVWNYDLRRFQVWEVTQKGLQKDFLSIIETEEYGNPVNYDVEVTKTGDGLNTEYKIIAKPPKAIDQKVAEQFNELEVNIEAVFEGDYPFD